jgi:hypothetical protein
MYVRNSIVWANESLLLSGDPQFTYGQGGVAQVCHSNVQSLGVSYCGTTSFDMDPQFVDLDGPDGLLGTADDSVRLAPSSPCIDAGDPTYINMGLDGAGFQRVLDGDLDGVSIVDMGSREYANIEVTAVPSSLKRGESVQVSIDSSADLPGALFVAAQRGIVPLPPFGLLLFEPSGGWARIDLPVLPAVITWTVPTNVELPERLILQGLVYETSTGFGNLSNAIVLEIK